LNDFPYYRRLWADYIYYFACAIANIQKSADQFLNKQCNSALNCRRKPVFRPESALLHARKPLDLAKCFFVIFYCYIEKLACFLLLYISRRIRGEGEGQMEVCQVSNPDVQRQKVEEIISAYRDKPGALIPVLHEIQNLLGYLPRWVQDRVSNAMNIPVSEVNSIISFYALFSEKPKGKYAIGVCKGTACYVRGADKIIEKLEEELGIEAGDTTPDGKFSIEVMRCLGACGLGPVMMVNEDVYTRMKADKVKEIINAIRQKDGGEST